MGYNRHRGALTHYGYVIRVKKAIQATFNSKIRGGNCPYRNFPGGRDK
jgi:hypothetical protein